MICLGVCETRRPPLADCDGPVTDVALSGIAEVYANGAELNATGLGAAL